MKLDGDPELLDYLAGELVRGGWKLKRLHRQRKLQLADKLLLLNQSGTRFFHCMKDRHEEKTLPAYLRSLEAFLQHHEQGAEQAGRQK